GSGPAYVFRFMELIQSAGEEMGLSPELARQMTLQTFLGASKLAIQSPESLAELRRRVTSPGGTTAAALEVFEKLGLEKLIKDGLIRARDRSIELSRK
ncbi:pyrroline-5-carboxylate reductase, partial [Candidatus Sumerlaeota bacterium]|nr:pyrroline-5-carboxylate reductase [Candidatus Sumerlaeota bacterium]